MALQKPAAEAARIILSMINPAAKEDEIREARPENHLEPDVIFGESPAKGGYQAVYMNIRNINSDQLTLFDQSRRQVGGSSFVRTLAKGITRIGWY